MAVEPVSDESVRASIDAEERAGPLLTISVLHVSSRVVRIAFTGELDSVSAPQARQVLDAAIEIGCAEIEADLRSLAFCGAAGLEVFRDAQHECAKNGGLLLLCNPQPAVLRVLELVGLKGLLTDWRT